MGSWYRRKTEYFYRTADGLLVQVLMSPYQHGLYDDLGELNIGGEKLVRDLQSEAIAKRSRRLPMTSGAYNRPLESVSLGVHPDQIPEFREQARNAGLTGIDFTKDGDVVFSSRGQRAKYLKLRGCIDRNGGYGD